MARIFYGIMGDARGHMSRSLSVVQHMNGHEFAFAGGAVVLELAALGYQVTELPILATLHGNGRVDARATIVNALSILTGRSRIVDTLARRIQEFDPDLIVTDYEYFTPLAARRLGRGCVSLDHQHVLTHCAFETPPGQKLSRLITRTLVKRLYCNAHRYLISSFFSPPVRDPETTEVLPPILRREIKEHLPSQGGHVVVYVSGMPATMTASSGSDSLLDILRGRQRNFLIYGLGERPQEENLIFRPRSTHGFLADLASCAYVITNGGHNLICEALYYGKPLLCFPIPMLYEQYVNAVFVKRCGFGEFCLGVEDLPSRLQRLEQDLEGYRNRAAGQAVWGNDLVAARLESLLGRG